MRPALPFRRLLRVWDYLLGNAAPKPQRARLGVEQIEERTMLTAVPLLADGGGTWVKVDTLTVATRTNQNVSTGVQSAVALEAGQTYLAVAHGMARIATDATGFADAEYIRYNKNTGPQDGSSTGLPWNNHGVRLAGVVGGTTTGNLWGTYQSDHQYVKTFVGQGTKVTGYYSDIPGYYGDNSGTLQVDLYALVPTVAVTAATSATEGGAAGTFTLTRTGGDQSQPLTAYFALGGTASATWDYTVTGATYDPARQRYAITFPAGAATAVVTLPTVDGDCPELDETVELTVLPDAPRYAVSANQARKTLTVADNDVTPDMVAPGSTWTDGSSVEVVNPGATWLRAEVVAPGWVQLSPVACGETGPAIWNDYAASVTGLDGYDGDATWEGDAGTLTLTAAGGIHDVTLHAAEDSLGNRSGRVTLHAGHDVGAVRAGEVAAITSGGTVGDVTAEWSVGDVSARSRVGAVLVVRGSVDGDVASATGSVGDVTASGDIKGSVTAAGDIGHVKAGDTLSASLTAGGSIASITVKDPEAAGDTPLLEHGTLDQVGWGVYSVDATTDRYEPVGDPGTGPRDAVDGKTVGGLTGEVRAGGNIGPVVVFGPVSKSVTAGGTIGTPIEFETGGVWAKGAVRGDIAAGAGGVTVRGWDLVEGSVTAPGAVAVWAVGDVSGAVTSTTKTATVGTFGDVTGAVTAAGEVDVRAAGSVGRDSLATSGTGSLIQSTGDAVLVWSGGTVAAPLLAKKYVAVYGKQGVAIGGTVKSSESDVSIAAPDGSVSGGDSLLDQLTVRAGRNVMLSAGKDVRGVDASGDQNVWAAAQGGDLGGTFVASEGWTYVWAKNDLTAGRAEAKGVVQATAGRDAKMSLTSTDDGVSVNAGRDVLEAVTGGHWADVRANGTVNAEVTAGDAEKWAAVSVQAGGDIVNKVTSSGYVSLSAAGSVSADATADDGWVDVTANKNITGDYKATDEITLWAGGDVNSLATAGGNVKVTAGGNVSGGGGGLTSTSGNVILTAGGNLYSNVSAKSDVALVVKGDILGELTVTSTAGDVSVLGGGRIEGVYEGQWVADVRSTNPAVDLAAAVSVRGKTTDLGSPWQQRLAVIKARLTELTNAGQGESDEAKSLRGEQDLIELQPSGMKFDENNVSADAVRDLLTNPQYILNQTRPAYEYQGPAISMPRPFWFDKVYETAGYVLVTDVIGNQGVTWVLEPFQRRHIPARDEYIAGGPGGPVIVIHHPATYEDTSLLGQGDASQRADLYKVVGRTASVLNGLTPEQYFATVRTQSWADNRVASVVTAIHGNNLNFQAAALDIGLSVLPLVGTANEIAKNGLTWEAGLSFGSDVATIFGVGALFKAEKCVSAATKAARYSVKASTVAMTLDGGIAAARIGQGIYSVGWHGGEGALGYFGDAVLRLAGVSALAIKRLRGPYCFAAGTPIHTEDGMRPVETIPVGSRVWGYDRGRQAWDLHVVTGASRTDGVRVVTAVLADGEELTGTPGHPVWVIEGENLGDRGRLDEGADEAPAGTPGRWVGLAGLRAGDVLLTRSGPARVSRVEVVAEPTAVYNLIVGGVHSYAVGARGVLAHNGSPEECQKAAKAAGEAAEQAAKEAPPVKPADPGSPAKPAGDAPPAPSIPKLPLTRPVTTRRVDLKPGDALPDSEFVTMVGSNTPKKFKLKPGVDDKPLEGVSEAGLSASITIDKTVDNDVIQAFGREAIKGDILIGASAKDIRAAGYDVLYAPTLANPNHVRIVARDNVFTENGSEWLWAAFVRLGKK